MNTPLQQAAQELIDRWDSPMWRYQQATTDVIAELRKALDAEIAQSVEPYAVFHGLVDSGEHGAFNLDLLKMIPRGAYLYLHPPQQATVKQYLKVGDSRFESWYSELNQAGKGSKQIAREAYEAGLNEADAQQAYDQQAMELCNVCGWKAIIPGEPCLVCNMNLDAQQAKQVPMTDNEIAMIAQLTQSAEPGNDGYILPFTFARAIEAHHSINK